LKSSDIELAPIRTGTSGLRLYPTRYADPLARISRVVCKGALIQWAEDKLTRQLFIAQAEAIAARLLLERVKD
jgi:hypothetical protein